MNNSDAARQRDGEYYLEEPRVGPEDRRQNNRIGKLESVVDELKEDVAQLWKVFAELKTALIGPDGKNGIRGTMNTHYNVTKDRLDKLEGKVDGLTSTVTDLAKSLSSLVSTLKSATKTFSAVGGILAAALVLFKIFSLLGL